MTKKEIEPQVYSNAEILNHFISKFNYQHYLEIGVCGYKDVNRRGETWHNIRIAHKDGVDPLGKPANYHMVSDDFFASIDSDMEWDIIFIDGNHQYKYVKRDLQNSLNHLRDDGIIVMHDVYPHPHHVRQGPPYAPIYSHVWCAIADFSLTRTDLCFYLLEVPIGRGICVIESCDRRPKKSVPEYEPGKPVNWSVVQDIKHKIFDRVILDGKYEELFE